MERYWELDVMVSYWELGVMESWMWWRATESWMWWRASKSWVWWRVECYGELLRAGCDGELGVMVSYWELGVMQGYWGVRQNDSGVFSFISTPVIQIFVILDYRRDTALSRRLHTLANGPIRVVLVVVSTEIKARFIIKCQLLYGMMFLCWSDYWWVWNNILCEMPNLLSV